MRRLHEGRTVPGVHPDGVLRGLPARIDHNNRCGKLVLRRLHEVRATGAARLLASDCRPELITAIAAGSWSCAGGMRGVPCSASLQTACLRDCMPGLITTIAAGSWSCAGCMKGARKAPPAFKIFAGNAPASRSCP
jgi:ribosomal protein L37AE/L43A